MTVPESIARFITKLYNTLRSETADWQKANQDELLQMRQAKAVAERELRQKLEVMEVRFKEERRRVQMEEERTTRHFSEFLDSIDEMKANMLAHYAAMPKPLALMIHHHAAELLKEAWHSPSAQVRLKRQTRFTDLMLTITEDLAELERAGERKALPEKTIAFIQNEGRQLPQGG
jgi:hypothetical protein